METTVGQLAKRHQEDGETSDPMNLRLVWRLSASSTPAYVSISRATPERYVLLVLGDGYQRPEPFDRALRRIVKGVSEDVGLAQLLRPGATRVYRDLQIWSLYYPEFTDLSVRPGPPSSTFLERYFSEVHMLSSPNIYPRTNELRRAIKKQHDIHVDKVLVLANVTQRGAGHTGGCLVVSGENEGAYRLFLHEMGHAIGLGDEYYWPGIDIPGPPKGSDYPYPNVSRERQPSGWKTVGEEGAMFTSSAYRPEKNCIMFDAEYNAGGSAWDSFCEVCKEQFRKFFILRQGRQPDLATSADGSLIETVLDLGPFPLVPENQRQNLPTPTKSRRVKTKNRRGNTAKSRRPG